MSKKKNIWPYIIFGVGLVSVAGVITAVSLSKKKKLKCNNRFLFIGDSNTAGNSSYADIFKTFCANAVVVKRAAVGAKTDWMLAQLLDELNAGNKYDAIIILGGSNDIYALNSTVDAKNNLQAMYNIAKQHGAKVVAISPPNKDFYPNKTEQKQKLLYDLVDWERKNKSIDFFIDLHKLTSNPALLASDYQHMNSAGQKALATVFKNTAIA